MMFKTDTSIKKRVKYLRELIHKICGTAMAGALEVNEAYRKGNWKGESKEKYLRFFEEVNTTLDEIAHAIEALADPDVSHYYKTLKTLTHYIEFMEKIES